MLFKVLVIVNILTTVPFEPAKIEEGIEAGYTMRYSSGNSYGG
jgi:hypothetical protein